MSEENSGNGRDQLLTQLEDARRRVRDLEKQVAEYADLEAPALTPAAALHKTLARVLKKACMILQAEKAVLLIYHRETGELVGQTPAVGIPDEQVHSLRLRATEGVTGQVFRNNEADLVPDVGEDPSGAGEFPRLIGWRNALIIPLIVESKDQDQVVVDRTTIGVMVVFNKRRGKEFSKEDLRLSRVLARNASAIIAEARLFSDVLERKTLLETSLESIHSGIMMVGGDGSVRLMNKAARAVFNISPTAEPTGKSYVEVVTHPDVVDIMSRSLSEQRDIDGEISVEDSTRFYHTQTAVVRDSGSISGIVAIFTDITEIRNLERLKATFVTTISHELGTPLSSILGFTRTMLEDEEGFFPADVRNEFLQIIEKECTKLNRLVADLRNMARIDEGRTLELHSGPVDLAELIRRVVAAQRSYATHHEFVVDMTQEFEDAQVVADEDKLDQVLTNLVNNAVKYAPSGGEIRVVGEAIEDGIRISVSDQGIGIPPDQLDKIFERFHKIETEGAGSEGAGIGLYIVRHLVELHGGKIEVESKFGEGSTFTMELPLAPPTSEPLGGSAAKARAS
ncbi:MAG: PAS domain-containing protein [Armatimonadia bacterium]|nr:PAS domain-containing protein [Armatimonadia bacterium]